MVWKNITPSKDTLESFGKVTYTESLRAWANIKFKKSVVDKFLILKRRDVRFSYHLIYNEEYSKIERILKNMRKNKETPPFLLIIRKD